MKITYDPKANAMYITFNHQPFHHTQIVSDTMILNMAEDETLIGIELLAVSQYT